jgi:hypothetical protein
MLIDLEWKLQTKAFSSLSNDYLKEFNTDNGGLIVAYHYPEEFCKFGDGIQFRRFRIAKRILKGIYCTGSNFHNEITNYTDFKSGFGNFNKRQKDLNDLLKLDVNSQQHEIARQKFLLELRKIPTEYGTADSLKQIYKYGKYFIKSEDPYVLSLSLLTQEDNGGFRWHKNGPYIGKHKNLGEYFSDTPEIDNIIQFHFHELEKKT